MTEDLPERVRALYRRADLAVILGSGLSALESAAGCGGHIPYTEIGGLCPTTVAGHPGRLSLGSIGGRPLLVLAGRYHVYEGLALSHAGHLAILAHRLGCSRLLCTHAAGALGPGIGAQSWLLASDVIALPFSARADGRGAAPSRRPLISTRLRREIAGAARAAGVPLREGVIFYTTGPAYETGAEARAAAALGAAAATMSTLPELAAARDCGIEAACLGWITNEAANVDGAPIGHDDVVLSGCHGARSLAEILEELI
jgi:inosine/guanosine/xanthosine phosphorylase family protein